MSSFFNKDDTKEEYNASEPVNDRDRWTDHFVHLLGHTGNYSPEEALALIEEHRILPDVLSFDRTRPARYPNGRVFTDDVINVRVGVLTNGAVPPTGLATHTDVLKDVPVPRDTPSIEGLATTPRPRPASSEGVLRYPWVPAMSTPAGTTFTGVSAQWIVRPVLPATPGEYSSEWLSIGGANPEVG